MNRIEEVKSRLLATKNDGYRFQSIEVHREHGSKKFFITLEIGKKEKSKRCLVTITISNRAIDNPSFNLYEYICKSVEVSVRMIIKKHGKEWWS